MLNLKKVLKSYRETGSLNEQVNLYGFVDPHAVLTKSGDVGVILQVHGVDYECLDGSSLDTLTKRLESALKLFDELSHLPVPLQAKQRANSLQEVCKPHRQHGYRESHSSLRREIRAALFASNVLRRRLRGLPLQAGSVKVTHRVS